MDPATIRADVLSTKYRAISCLWLAKDQQHSDELGYRCPFSFQSTKVPTKSIAQVYTPDRDIVGRAGAVRIRNWSGIDLCVGIDEELQEMIDDADRDGDGEVKQEDFSSKGDS